MGANTKELRQRIAGVGNIQKITRAMEMVATTKLRKMQNRAEGSRPYADTIRRLSASLATSAEEGSSDLTRARDDVKRVAILVVSADRGLCGSYNSNLFRAVTQHVENLSGVESRLYVLGKKARSHFSRRLSIHQAYADEVERLDYRRARAIAGELSNAFLAGSADPDGVDEVWVVYTRFVSVGRQVPTAERLLPIVASDDAADGEGDQAPAANEHEEMLLEPSPEMLLRALLPKSLAVRIFAAMLDSMASEMAARRMAMKAATDAAGDMITSLRRRYNRARQETITSELLDIVGGAEALQ